MPCYKPLDAFRASDGSVKFHSASADGRAPASPDLRLPCGQCVGCRLDRARDWSLRCIHEATQHQINSFITLTYSQIPEDGSLNHRHFQLFIKRLRRKRSTPIRYFMCGEYGERLERPHYHACLFGCGFPDARPHGRNAQGDLVYVSKELETLWSHGFCTIGQVTKLSAGYVARYCLKKVTGDQAASHYRWVDSDGVIHERLPEYARMSLKPGVGSAWFHRYRSDVLPNDYVIHDGAKHPVPRYYDKLQENIDRGTTSVSMDEVKYRREQYGRSHQDNNTPDRLAVREEVVKARIRQLKRS